MNQDSRDTDEALKGLQILSAQLRSIKAPSRVEANLVRVFQGRQNNKHHARVWRRLFAPAATIMIIAIAILALQYGPEPPVRSNIVASELTTGYIPIGIGNPVDPTGFTSIVRISLPHSEMSKFGLPVQAELEQNRITADVLLGEDGIAKAIRFVH